MNDLLTLKKNLEFQRVFKKGKWVGGDYLSIYFLPNKKKSNYIGIAVSKKVTKSSVKRNRIRRLIREAYRMNETMIMTGFDFVFVWKLTCPYEQAEFHKIKQDIMKAFRKMNIWIEKGE